MAKYKTMQGREIDMDKLMTQNELMPAIGNVRVNARGDELGQGGKIIRKREEVIAEYYENNPKAIPERSQPVKDKKSEVVARQPIASEPVVTSKKTRNQNEN
jgi:hypothetical protein